MSKKYFQQEHPQSQALGHAAEYKIIRRDLVRVVILNVVYLAGILALFFSNQKSHFLENWFYWLFRF